MAAGEIRVGQILPLIFVVKDQDGVIVNLAAATSKMITILTPNSGKKVFQASLVTNGSDGQMQYVTQNDANQTDLDLVGIYEAQGKVTIGGIDYPSDIVTFEVKENL
jgi:hypothetical protein